MIPDEYRPSLTVNICIVTAEQKITSPDSSEKNFPGRVCLWTEIKLNHREHIQYLCAGFSTWMVFFPKCVDSAIELKFYLWWKSKIDLFKSKCTEWTNLSFYKTCLILIQSSKAQDSFILTKNHLEQLCVVTVSGCGKPRCVWVTLRRILSGTPQPACRWPLKSSLLGSFCMSEGPGCPKK